LPLIVLLSLATLPAGYAQIDQSHRRMVVLQSTTGLNHSEEQSRAVGFFWFNQDNYPWDNTALRVIFAGVFLDTELSVFLSEEETTALGFGLDTAAFIDGASPYVDGERLSHQSFYGDHVGARFFVDHQLAEFPLTQEIQIPLHVRGTYRISGRWFRDSSGTQNFVLPDEFLLQSVLADLRLGALRPKMPSREGAELYLGLEASYRTGAAAFGPTGNLYPAHSQYQRAIAQLAGEFPAGPVRLYGRLAGAVAEGIDELSAIKLGGNLLNSDAFSYPVHGYYTREILAEDFGLVNLEIILPLTEEHALNLHCYGDYAAAHTVPPQDGRWHSYFGTGAGVSFEMWWQVRTLISYGYGFNAVRNGDHGAHELGLALQKSF
jgi:hypothetical protein